MPALTCHVIEQASLTTSTAVMLVNDLRKLRRLVKHCTKCHQRATCEDISYYNTSLQTAITEINTEWERNN